MGLIVFGAFDAGGSSPAGIPSSEAFGAVFVNAKQRAALTGISSAEAFEAPRVNLRLLFIGASGAGIFGVPKLSNGGVIIRPTGIPR